MRPSAWIAAAALALAVASLEAIAEDARFGPADPVVKDADQLDPKRPIEHELAGRACPTASSAVAVGDLIISRPLSQHAEGCRRSAQYSTSCAGTDVTFGNLETTIFEPRTFEGAPYSWDGDWTNASVPAVARDLKAMGFSIVGRANNHSQDWGLDGHARDGALARRSRHPPCRRGRFAPRWRARRPTSKARRAASPLVSFASTFRPTSESLPPAATAPGRPGLSALRVTTTAQVPRIGRRGAGKSPVLAERHALQGRPDAKGIFFGTAYRQADRFSYEHAMDPGDLAEIYAAIRSAQLNADFVIAAIHSHECSIGCDDDDAPRGAAELPEATRARRHRLRRGHVRGHRQPQSRADRDLRFARHAASGRSSTGSAISSGATCRSCFPPTCSRGIASCCRTAWQDPEKATEYDLTAPLNKQYFAHAFTFQSVIAEARFQGQPAVGDRAAPRGARLRRPADDERHSATGCG